MSDTDEKLLTEQEVARWIRVTPRTLRRWRRAAYGPTWIELTQGEKRMIRYDATAIEAWLCEREAGRE